MHEQQRQFWTVLILAGLIGPVLFNAGFNWSLLCSILGTERWVVAGSAASALGALAVCAIAARRCQDGLLGLVPFAALNLAAGGLRQRAGGLPLDACPMRVCPEPPGVAEAAAFQICLLAVHYAARPATTLFWLCCAASAAAAAGSSVGAALAALACAADFALNFARLHACFLSFGNPGSTLNAVRSKLTTVPLLFQLAVLRSLFVIFPKIV